MIKSFKSKEAEKIFRLEKSKKFPPEMQRTALRKLKYLDAVIRLDALRVPPGNQLEALRGNRAGQYSIRINDQWRICFEWQDGDAVNVEIVDYH